MAIRIPQFDETPALQQMHGLLEQLTGNDLSVVITGEDGTGKELIAHALHQLSNRKHAPFITVNTTTVTPHSLHTLFEHAQNGVLFFDEISEMSDATQVELLHILQEETFHSSTDGQPKKYDLRIIVSSRHNLVQLADRGQFQKELFYRLNVASVRVPPVREHPKDIPALANHFLQRACEKTGKSKIFDAETLAIMESYHWPGNTREMENIIMRLCVLSPDSIIGKETFLAEIRAHHKNTTGMIAQPVTLERDIRNHLEQYFAAHTEGQLPPPGLYDRILPLFEKPLIEMTLKATHGNQLKAARVLGLNRNTLRKKITALQIDLQKLTG